MQFECVPRNVDGLSYRVHGTVRAVQVDFPGTAQVETEFAGSFSVDAPEPIPYIGTSVDVGVTTEGQVVFLVFNGIIVRDLTVAS